MVTFHVETLIERLTGGQKAKRDADGAYPIRYRSALYFVRVVPAWKPVVQIFSVAVDGIRLTGALARDLNEISSRLHLWVRDQALVEAEHLGPSLTGADFHECALHAGDATVTFAKGLAGGTAGGSRSRKPRSPNTPHQRTSEPATCK